MSKRTKRVDLASVPWKVQVKCSARTAELNNIQDIIREIQANLNAVASCSEPALRQTQLAYHKGHNDLSASENTITPAQKRQRNEQRHQKLMGYLRFVQERKRQEKDEIIDWNRFQRRISDEWRQLNPNEREVYYNS